MRWYGDEALAIAVYCTVKYADDFEKGVTSAVNHDGDSDSTGSIAGDILGAARRKKDNDLGSTVTDYVFEYTGSRKE